MRVPNPPARMIAFMSEFSTRFAKVFPDGAEIPDFGNAVRESLTSLPEVFFFAKQVGRLTRSAASGHPREGLLINRGSSRYPIVRPAQPRTLRACAASLRCAAPFFFSPFDWACNRDEMEFLRLMRAAALDLGRCVTHDERPSRSLIIVS
jgi:hypothetical protein